MRTCSVSLVRACFVSVVDAMLLSVSSLVVLSMLSLSLSLDAVDAVTLRLSATLRLGLPKDRLTSSKEEV